MKKSILFVFLLGFAWRTLLEDFNVLINIIGLLIMIGILEYITKKKVKDAKLQDDEEKGVA